MPSKLTLQQKEAVLKVIDGVCHAMASDMYMYVSEWGCFKEGNLEVVLALLDGRDRDNFLHGFGKFLAEQPREFASND